MDSHSNKILSKDIFLNENTLFLSTGMEINNHDLYILKKWGFNNLQKVFQLEENQKKKITHKSSKTNDSKESNHKKLKIDPQKIKNVFSKAPILEKKIIDFSHILITNLDYFSTILITNLDYFSTNESKILKILESLRYFHEQMKDEFLFYVKITSSREVENLIFFNVCLTNFMAHSLKINDNDSLKDLFLTSILSKSYFLKSPIEKIKLFLEKENLTITSTIFYKKQIAFILELLKTSHLPEKVKKLLLLQYKAIDEKSHSIQYGISDTVDILSIISKYLFSRHPFLEFFALDKPYLNPSNFNIFKSTEEIPNKISQSFYEIVGIHDIGVVLKLKEETKNSGISIAIILKNIGLDPHQKPIVKVIINDEKQIDYSTELIDLNERDDLHTSLINDDKITTLVKKIFFKNIIEDKYLV